MVILFKIFRKANPSLRVIIDDFAIRFLFQIKWGKGVVRGIKPAVMDAC